MLKKLRMRIKGQSDFTTTRDSTSVTFLTNDAIGGAGQSGGSNISRATGGSQEYQYPGLQSSANAQ